TDVAREEMRQLLARIDKPGFTPIVAREVIKRAVYIERHTRWIPKSLLEKEKTKGFSELRALEMKHSAIFRTWGQIAQSARDKFRTDPRAYEELRKLEKDDAELQALFDFRPVTITYHWDVIGENFKARLPFSFAFAFLFFIFMIKARELKLAVELMNPLSLIIATATYPVSWLIYPYKDPRQQMSRVVNAMGMAFSILMAFGGVASAQTVKKGESGKKRDQQVKLQTDTRVMVPLGDDPETSTLFNRATFDFGKAVVENISLVTPAKDSWYSETCVGPKFGPIAKTSLIAVGCVTKAKGTEPGWAAGIQAYRPFGKRFFMAVPVARMEGKTLNFLGSISAKIGKGWSVVPEVNFKLAPGKRPFRSVGIALRRSFGRGSAEASFIRNGFNQPILRPRLIQNFAF
ncbi:MAG: hypothetical protein NUV54_00665, partial [Candidatus Taylorbacteria bacterium]|nr:hypothetical protein [Candidatus Taylorbacteria bacterium]